MVAATFKKKATHKKNPNPLPLLAKGCNLCIIIKFRQHTNADTLLEDNEAS
jgi:hypothetical protein